MAVRKYSHTPQGAFMLSLVSSGHRLRKAKLILSGVEIATHIRDTVLVVESNEGISDALRKKWGGHPGVHRVKPVGDNRAEIIISGQLREAAWLRHFGTSSRKKRADAVVGTLNKL